MKHIPNTIFLFFVTISLISSCVRTGNENSPVKEHAIEELPPLIESQKNKGTLVSAHVIDFQGFSETIANKERLSQLEKKNFLLPQQYRKVLRVFKRTNAGNSMSLITSYHENGQIFRYLECVNGRACGNFREWHENGALKIEASLLSGSADIDDTSMATWTFQGLSRVWSSEGHLIGFFTYDKGLLSGAAKTLYPTGKTKSESSYKEGVKDGVDRFFEENGVLIEEVSFKTGIRHGPSVGYWEDGSIKYRELFDNDNLKEASYFAKEKGSSPLSLVTDGEGVRSLFDGDLLLQQQQISEGRPAGWVKIYSGGGIVIQEYSEIDGEKHGRELFYYPSSKDVPLRKKLAVEWKHGAITGTVETWYSEGPIESRRELKQNEKDGMSLTWYPDGSLMLVEEYEKGLLKKGRYHKILDPIPYSTVDRGKGTATIFDRDGRVVEKIIYQNGKPVVE